LTAEWEQQLKDIEEGRCSAAAFYQSITDFVRAVVPKVAAGAALSPEQMAAAREQQPFRKQEDRVRDSMSKNDLGMCPLCKQGTVMECAKAYSCNRYREGCQFTIWKAVADKKLSEKQVKALLTRGYTDWLRGFTSKAGKTFEARLKLGEDFKVAFDFERSAETRVAPRRATEAGVAQEVLTCPKCGQGKISEGKRGHGCNRYREGCDFGLSAKFEVRTSY
jgi:DNA topoisomerase-3